ncbi:hypothetical protein PCANC_15549 [Puccinia coronata f. sp. avenae]|uniref:Uncharacterized protein n=1 Tax=Puccinia coronata f. sp. avenae TaxID=200324 RepID=A0A2N5SX68_9BASI|nr:hypothetical protein PCANC_15549 [Puccinia coronata f. sp. avenae]
MKITGIITINILFSVSAICAVELASSSEKIPHIPDTDWEITSDRYLGRNWVRGVYALAFDQPDLVIGTKKSAFHLEASKGAEPDTIKIHNHSPQKLDYRLKDLNIRYWDAGERRFNYRWLFGIIGPDEKFTISATQIQVDVKPRNMDEHLRQISSSTLSNQMSSLTLSKPTQSLGPSPMDESS